MLPAWIYLLAVAAAVLALAVHLWTRVPLPFDPGTWVLLAILSGALRHSLRHWAKRLWQLAKFISGRIYP